MAKIVLIAATLGLLACGNVVAAPADESDGQLLRGKAALGGWEQDKPGLRRQLTPKDLPPIGKSTPNFVEVVPMPAGAKPRVPAGFSVDIAVQPATGSPWCAVNERDELGDDTPFEYATEVKENAFYGWPWYYIGDNEDPSMRTS
jgi:hypothetical protein